MESARRWSGFVCPDCRFVFRVPRDHDGRGVVCPSCRRMLRIPVAGDRPPPLVVPIRQQEPPKELSTTTAAEEDPHRRRKRKSRRGEGHTWDSSSGRRGARRGERRQMMWMLVGGSTALVLIVGGVLAAMFGGSPAEAPAPALPVVSAGGGAKAPENAITVRGDAEFLRLAEPMAKAFLEARTVDDLLPLVRNPERAAERIRRAHPDGTLDAPGMAAFNIDLDVIRQGNISSVRVRTRDFSESYLSFVETAGGPKIDWESWAGWSEVPWDDFLTEKPAAPRLFRAVLSDVDYYNMAFRDESKWRSYRLESPDGLTSIYGYAERDSVTDARLRPSPDVKRANFTLRLRFPEGAESRNQVMIEGVLGDGWVLENEDFQ